MCAASDDVVEIFRTRFHAQDTRMAYAAFSSFGCTQEEQSQILEIKEFELVQLQKFIMQRLCAGKQASIIRVVCLGKSVQASQCPAPVGEYLQAGMGGFWSPSLGAVFVRFGFVPHIRRIVIHELAHGLIHGLSDGFLYPIALEEGIAHVAEYKMGDTGWSDGKYAGGQSGLSDKDYVPIKELLLFPRTRHLVVNRAVFGKVAWAAFWLEVFLRKLAKCHPVLTSMFRELRVNNVTTPGKAWEWMQTAVRMSEAQLEKRFAIFCRTLQDPCA